jgi:hypothetical protein
MLDGISVAAAVKQDRLAQSVLQPVDLKQKLDLAFESIAVPRDQTLVYSDCHWPDLPVRGQADNLWCLSSRIF